MRMRNRIGPKMAWAIDYVRVHGPCVAIDVARYVGPHGSLNYGYRTVHRCLRAGLLRSVPHPTRPHLRALALAGES